MEEGARYKRASLLYYSQGRIKQDGLNVGTSLTVSMYHFYAEHIFNSLLKRSIFMYMTLCHLVWATSVWYINIYIYTHTHTHTHIYIYIYTHTHTHTHTYIYIHIYYTYIHTHIYIYTHTYINMYIHKESKHALLRYCIHLIIWHGFDISWRPKARLF